MIIHYTYSEVKERTMDYRDYTLELVDEGLVDARDLLVMAVKYMSQDDVRDMITVNELEALTAEDA